MTQIFHNFSNKYQKLDLNLSSALIERASLYPVVSINTALCEKLAPNCLLKRKHCEDHKTNGINITIKVSTLTGKIYPISINSSNTIEDLKNQLYKLSQTPQDQMRLVFKGRQLADELSINDCDIKDNDTIHLILYLRGGMYHATSGHSNLYKLFPLDIYIQKNNFSLTIEVHQGITIQELLELIVKGANQAQRVDQVNECSLFYGEIPLASKDVKKDTLSSLGITEKNKIPIVLISRSN